MRLGIPFLGAAVVAAMLYMSVGKGDAQNQQVAQAPSEHKTIAGAIDGSTNPELIPDSVAFRMFYRALWEPVTATTDQTARQRAKVSRAQLSESDLGQMFSSMAAFGTNLVAFEKDVHATQAYGPGLSSEQISAFTAQRDALVASTTAELQAHLSADGMERLSLLIRSEKKNMTILPVPDMSGAEAAK